MAVTYLTLHSTRAFESCVEVPDTERVEDEKRHPNKFCVGSFAFQDESGTQKSISSENSDYVKTQNSESSSSENSKLKESLL